MSEVSQGPSAARAFVSQVGHLLGEALEQVVGPVDSASIRATQFLSDLRSAEQNDPDIKGAITLLKLNSTRAPFVISDAHPIGEDASPPTGLGPLLLTKDGFRMYVQLGAFSVSEAASEGISAIGGLLYDGLMARQGKATDRPNAAEPSHCYRELTAKDLEHFVMPVEEVAQRVRGQLVS